MDGIMQHAGEYKYLLEMRDQLYPSGGPAAMDAANALLLARAVLDDRGRRVSDARPRTARDAISLLEEEMDVDISLLRKGVIRKDANSKGRNKVYFVFHTLSE